MFAAKFSQGTKKGKISLYRTQIEVYNEKQLQDAKCYVIQFSFPQKYKQSGCCKTISESMTKTEEMSQMLSLDLT